jgi:hypothetical protein
MKKLFLFLPLLSTLLFANENPKVKEEKREELILSFKDRYQVIEAEVSLLYLSSTISTPFSNEILLFNSGSFSQFTNILNLKTASVIPDYDPGFEASIRYHVPSSNHVIACKYRYIYNNSDTNLKRDIIDTAPNGLVQRNMQDDYGHQHIHIHTADLLLHHFYSFTKAASLYISSGLSLNDIFFFFSFHNLDHIINSQNPTPTTVPTQTQLEIRGNRKARIWALGPKLGIGFEYNFLPVDWPHDLNLDMGFEFSMQFAKKWGKGKFNGTGFQIASTNSNANFSRRWEDGAQFELIPNVNLDMSLQYRYCTIKGMIFGLTVGYRMLTFWEIYDLTREINYRMEMTQPVLATQLREDDSVGFAGPYLSLSLAY